MEISSSEGGAEESAVRCAFKPRPRDDVFVRGRVPTKTARLQPLGQFIFILKTLMS